MRRTRVGPWAPLGRALLDYHRGLRDRCLEVRSDLWDDELVPVADYYRPDDHSLPEIERRALRRCRGRVLDAGAGAGRHALELVRRGLEVVAVDVDDDAVAVARGRGVPDCRRADLFDLQGERFDTVLMMMHGLGVVGDIAGLGRLLQHLPTLLADGGQLLCDSADLTVSVDPDDLESSRRGRRRRSYTGEVRFQLAYGELSGAWYRWLFVDPGTLTLLASAAGLKTEILAQGDRGAYLARITCAGPT